MRYYKIAKLVFERQVEAYGGWDKLEADTRVFQEVRAHLEKSCLHTLEQNQGIVVTARMLCMVAKYRQQGLAARFDEL